MNAEEHEWADTIAAKLFAEGLARAKAELGLSVRKVGKELGFKQATFVSRMSSGKSPIPVDRAEEIAALLMIEPSEFLQAVVKQRYPDVNWQLLHQSGGNRHHTLEGELEEITGAPLSELNEHQRRVIKEVATEPQPQLRWLSVLEASAVRRLANQDEQQEDFATSQEDIDEILARLSEDES